MKLNFEPNTSFLTEQPLLYTCRNLVLLEQVPSKQKRGQKTGREKKKDFLCHNLERQEEQSGIPKTTIAGVCRGEAKLSYIHTPTA